MGDASTGTNQTPAGAGRSVSRRRLLAAVGVLGVGGLGAAAVGAGAWSKRVTAGPTTSGATSAATARAATFLVTEAMHTLSLVVDKDDFTAMLAAYRAEGTKGWLKANLTIDGSSYSGVGIRLKGNSSLKSVSEASTAETLPWLVRLDKYSSGVNHLGMTELVVRSNTSKTALNEAVALDLLAASGLASQQAAMLRFSVNGSAEVLRLAVENPAKEWAARVFTVDGLLYKAEASGDYSYRGTDPSSYAGSFDVEAGDDDLGPLISFLDFVNNSSDADFTSRLSSRLNVSALVTYLAFEELIDNFDDIDGPGNNSYLWWDRDAGAMTVVAWDHNLAFGLKVGGDGREAGGPGLNGPGALPNGTPPEMATPTAGFDGARPPAGAPPQGLPGQGSGGDPRMRGKANALVSRFNSLADGTAKVASAKSSLKAQLFTGGVAGEALRRRADLISTKAADLVSSEVLATEQKAVATYLA